MRKTVFKTIAYKLISLCELVILALILTGSIESATHIGIAHLSLSAVTYAGFELLWAKLV